MEGSTMVAGIRARDPEVAAAFYDKYQGRINGLVWRMLGRDDEHDDVVQQVFAQVLDSIDRLRDPDLLEPWLVRLTVNTVLKIIRRRRMARILHKSQKHAEDYSADLGPESQQLAIRVYEVLDKLGARERVVFALRYIEGNTLSECAQAMGCSVATVKRCLVKARRTFEKHAEKDPVLASWTQGEGNE